MLFNAFVITMVWSVLSVNSQYSGYVSWKPPGSARTDLYCPTTCQANSSPSCCACNSQACWEMNPKSSLCETTIADLHLEYVNIIGDSIVMKAPSDTDATHFRLLHTGGRMRYLPSNICEFPNILILDLSNNCIIQIGNISCLKELNEFDLSDNEIIAVSNTTFLELSNLRTLNLGNNNILDLDADTFKLAAGSVFSVDLSGNKLYKIDITNVILEGMFCLRNFSGSLANDTTNDSNYHINKITSHTDLMFGPGDIDFSYSNIGYPPNVTEIGIPFNDIQKYCNIGYKITNSTTRCDCSLVHILKSFHYPYSVRMFPDLATSFVCIAPPHMKGRTIDQFYDNVTLSSFLCGIQENCPLGCKCTDDQNKGVVVVNCTNAGLTRLPYEMPVGLWNNRKLELILDGNNITEFTDREYLERVSVLTTVDNPLFNIDVQALELLPQDAFIDISSMKGDRLPDSIRRLDPSRIKFSDHPITCDCSNIWLGDWLRAYDSKVSLLCVLHGKIVQASSVSSLDMQCESESSVVMINFTVGFAVVVTALLVSGFALVYFRFELFVLQKRLVCKRSPCDNFIFDVFLSLDDKYTVPEWNISIEKWFISRIEPALQRSRIRAFVPFCDVVPGCNLCHVVPQAISDSQIFIIILTKSYMSNLVTLYEFKLIWEQYRKHSNKDIILINYNYLSMSDVSDRRMKALLRASRPLDFSETGERMIKRLVATLHGNDIGKTSTAWK